MTTGVHSTNLIHCNNISPRL